MKRRHRPCEDARATNPAPFVHRTVAYTTSPFTTAPCGSAILAAIATVAVEEATAAHLTTLALPGENPTAVSHRSSPDSGSAASAHSTCRL